MARYVMITSVFVAAFVALLDTSARASILAGNVTSGTNTLNDRDRERLVGSDDTIIDVGEMLEAAVIIDNLDNAIFSQELMTNINGPNYQLTAHVLLTVESVSDPEMDGFATFTFSGGFADGSLVKLYEDTTGQDTGFGTDADTTIANATDEDLILSLGFVDADDFWTAEGPLDISLIGAAGSGDAAQYNFGLSVLGATDIPIQTNGEFSTISGSFHDVVGFGQAFSIAGEANGWDAATDTTVSFQVEAGVIPEPSALMVWAGILILPVIGGHVRRRVRG